MLLAIYTSMLALSSLHVHRLDSTEGTGNVCSECINHQSHAGHLQALKLHLYDCVLCQIIQAPVMFATPLALSFFLSLLPSTCLVIREDGFSREWETISLRAPPTI